MRSHELIRMRIDHLNKLIPNYPKGTITDNQGKETIYITYHPDTKMRRKRFRTSTKKGKQLKDAVIYRNYLEKSLNKLYIDLQLLNAQTVIKLPRKDDNLIDSKTLWEIAKMNADSNTAFPKPENGPTFNGTKFRSKSEMTLAVTLNDMGIEYVYEPLLNLIFKAYYPDFVIYIPEIEKVIIIEYFGMMGKYDYRERSVAKIRDYLSEGLTEGRDIIFFFETDQAGIDADVFENKINAAILANVTLRK